MVPRSFKRVVASLLVITMFGPILAIGFVQPRPAQAAVPIWYFLMPLANKLINDLVNPPRTEVWPASAPVMMLETPDGRPLPPVAVTRQQAIILRKGVRIRGIKPGVVGPPLERLDYYRDGDRSTMVSVKEAPWVVGTARGHQGFDTASSEWQVGGIYTLNLYFECERDVKAYGREGWNALQAIVQDDSFFQWAITDPSYRQFLADGMGAIPAIPVARHVDDQGRVGYSVGDGPPAFAQAGGVVQPSQPVAGEQREGLWVRFFLRGVPVMDGTVHLNRAVLTQVPLVVRHGPLVARTIVKILGPDGTEYYSQVREGVSHREIDLRNYPAGTYTVQAQGQASDNSLSPAVQVQLTIQ